MLPILAKHFILDIYRSHLISFCCLKFCDKLILPDSVGRRNDKIVNIPIIVIGKIRLLK